MIPKKLDCKTFLIAHDQLIGDGIPFTVLGMMG